MTMLGIEITNLALNAALIAAFVVWGVRVRNLYYSLSGELTALGDAGRQVRRLIAQSEALLRENEEAWRRYEAAKADAERQRVRFLEHKIQERDVADGGGGDATDADDGGTDE